MQRGVGLYGTYRYHCAIEAEIFEGAYFGLSKFEGGRVGKGRGGLGFGARGLGVGLVVRRGLGLKPVVVQGIKIQGGIGERE